MSKVDLTNEKSVHMTHRQSGSAGQMLTHDRITKRGDRSRGTYKETETYAAIFTLNESIYCQLSEVPFRAGFFETEDGRAEITQFIERFTTEVERNDWILSDFI